MASSGKITKQQLVTDEALKAFDELRKQAETLRSELKLLVVQTDALGTSNRNLNLSEEELQKTEQGRAALTKEYEKLKKKEIQLQTQIATANSEVARNVQLLSKEKANLNAQTKSGIKSFAQEQKAAKVSASAYLTLKSNLDKAILSYQNLLSKRAQGNALTAKEVANLNTLEKEVNDLSKAYKKVDSQLTTTTGGVRKTSSSFDSLGFSVAQITRESPAFINSMNTGFMAISNNIPTLVDEINKLKKANVDLAASGKPTKNVLAQVGKAFFSWQSLISASIVLLTVFGPKLIKMAQNAIAGAKGIDRMADAIENLDDNTKDSIGGLISLISKINDVNVSEGERLGAMNDLNDKYPEFNANILGEKDNLELVNKEVEKYIELAIKRAATVALEKEIGEIALDAYSLGKDKSKLLDEINSKENKIDTDRLNRLVEIREKLADENLAFKDRAVLVGEYDKSYFLLTSAQKKYLDLSEEEQEAKLKLINLEGELSSYRTEGNKIAKDTIDYYGSLISKNNDLITSGKDGKALTIEVIRDLQKQNEGYQKQIDLIKGVSDANKNGGKDAIIYLEGSIGYLQQIIKENNTLIAQATDNETRTKLREENALLQEQLDILSKARKYVDPNSLLSGKVLNDETDNGLPRTMPVSDDFSTTLLEDADKFLEEYGDAIDQATDLTNAFFDNRIEKLAQDRDANEEYYDNLINLASGNQEEQDKLQAQKEIKDEELRKKQNKLAKKQAIIDRTVTIAKIAFATALSVQEAVAASPLTAGLPWSAINATLGAAQIAAVLSQPLPQFAEGGKMDKDGFMMINDHSSGRQEYIERNGKIFTTTTKNAIVEGQRDDIIHKDLNSLLSNKNFSEEDIHRASILTSLRAEGGNLLKTEKVLDNALKDLDKKIIKGVRGAFKNVNMNTNVNVDMNWNRFKNDRL